jgi:DNA-binding CsgD family transcriptional regulator
MADPMRQPTSIDWVLATDAGGAVWVGQPSPHYDPYEGAYLHSMPGARGFEVSLGSFTTTGDATDADEAKRCAEAAFRALIDLNNRLSAPRVDLSVLSAREREIAETLRTGRRPHEIAAVLRISHHTVRTHLKQVYRKLGIRSQVALVAAMGGHRG